MISILPSRHPEVRLLGRQLGRVAPTMLPLLLEGETGTGKSWVAARLHRASRPGRPLVVVDCGALSPGLLASELFGHRAGAFTDATRARSGWLDRAGDGTLVLDRLDSLPAEGQVALLRVLEEARFYPVGAGQPRPMRARVVALVDAGVSERVERGELRPDLFHRLAGLHLVLPPLRSRPRDILPFADAHLRCLAGRGGQPARLHAEALELVQAYPWPGNYRELATVLDRAALMADGSIGVAELALPGSAWPQVAATAAERGRPLAAVARLYALWVLAQAGGNVSRAARVLGVSRRTLIRWRRETTAS
ncbi:MAG: sigma 54-interacting transcriptional regulator [Thermoanaerobaculaceae bacterium]|nr:sigma 54-interacting transcriptional regulator [Thermoanaerobaculaceae bacterium]